MHALKAIVLEVYELKLCKGFHEFHARVLSSSYLGSPGKLLLPNLTIFYWHPIRCNECLIVWQLGLGLHMKKLFK